MNEFGKNAMFCERTAIWGEEAAPQSSSQGRRAQEHESFSKGERRLLKPGARTSPAKGQVFSFGHRQPGRLKDPGIGERTGLKLQAAEDKQTKGLPNQQQLLYNICSKPGGLYF